VSVFIIVPIIHTGRFRYSVGSRCTQNLAQMQWYLFFLLTSTAIQVVTESSNCKRSTLVERILSTADTALKTDAWRSLINNIQREPEIMNAGIIEQNPPQPIVRDIEAYKRSMHKILEQNEFALGAPKSPERLENLGLRTHFSLIAYQVTCINRRCCKDRSDCQLSMTKCSDWAMKYLNRMTI
jgi:hypothetical protein